jgi:hypothetical protein
MQSTPRNRCDAINHRHVRVASVPCIANAQVRPIVDRSEASRFPPRSPRHGLRVSKRRALPDGKLDQRLAQTGHSEQRVCGGDADIAFIAGFGNAFAKSPFPEVVGDKNGGAVIAVFDALAHFIQVSAGTADIVRIERNFAASDYQRQEGKEREFADHKTTPKKISQRRINQAIGQKTKKPPHGGLAGDSLDFKARPPGHESRDGSRIEEFLRYAPGLD